MALVIAIEGVDSAGKKTQTEKLTTFLKTCFNSDRVKSVAFPRYDGPCGDLIKKLLTTDLYGFGNIEQAQIIQSVMLADRLDGVCDFNKDDVVVCDRYYMSGIVYGQVDELSEPWLHKMHASLPKANLQILIDVDPVKARERRPTPRDNYEKNLKKQQQIRQRYLDIWNVMARRHPYRWVVVDGNNPEDAVATDIQVVTKLFLNAKSYWETSDAAY